MASIKYKIYKNNSSAGKMGKFYARAYHDETITLEELAEHMSLHNTPYSKGTIHGVLKDMVACVRELLLDSKKVKLDNLAIFSLGLTSKPADSPQEFSAATHILKAYINAMGTGEIAKKQLDVAARFKEVGEYSREEASMGTPSEGGNTQTMYTLSLTASPAEGGSVSGAGTYEAGASVSIQATANTGYTFTRWSDGDTNASRSVTVNNDLTLTAEFTAASGGGGTDPEEPPFS